MSLQKKTNLPRNVTIQLTELCNLRCRMCYYWGERGAYSSDIQKTQPAILDKEILLRLINNLQLTKPHYSFFGGEPLTYPYIEEIITAIKSLGSSIDMPTNGTRLEAYSSMLVRTKFDRVRVSIDGTEEINDLQRGKGSYKKAMEGIRALYHEKQTQKSQKPLIEIIYTITPTTYNAIEEFFLTELDLDLIDSATLQMQNFMTKEMGRAYSTLLKDLFEIESNSYWQALICSLDELKKIDTLALSNQVQKVRTHFSEHNIRLNLEPPTFTPKNLYAYLNADWTNMEDIYETCYVPWASVDITATGDVAPCHIFYDLTMGNLYKNSFEEIWNNEKFQRFRVYMKKYKLMPICYGCCILYLAGKRKRRHSKRTRKHNI
ncbi:MAG: putative Radical SAM additional 4Fe4S-binding SPASM domain-containing protein [Promethearchaeota archaeon]|nr:MAG: putative Radical SAM additional 4Fe4S-binding SPASM domain-containing protein [Candidatus Lokiarchaeota archaeon]